MVRQPRDRADLVWRVPFEKLDVEVAEPEQAHPGDRGPRMDTETDSGRVRAVVAVRTERVQPSAPKTSVKKAVA